MADNIPSGPEFRTGRSDSTSSASTDASSLSSSPRRRSSAMFEGLQAQKRSNDPASVARRQSMNEQRPASGFFGTMWNNYVRGK
ncbi:hypothetical protein QBC35DRAFT_451210 [Podospora australis]|uniref:Conidiation-specific expression protein n=1 Tax=Podospora australis TaxID=1536484 RepID=A0AAN6WV43_9PEZI|nr:hypothetical protein QBC35DRAFT_451210 [Podospora australis]